MLYKIAYFLCLALAGGRLSADETAGLKLNVYDSNYSPVASIIKMDGFPEVVLSNTTAKPDGRVINEEKKYIVNIKAYRNYDDAHQAIRSTLTNYYQDKKSGELLIVNEVIYITQYIEMYCGDHKYGLSLVYYYSTQAVDGSFHPANDYGVLGSVTFIDTNADGKFDLMSGKLQYSNFLENLPDIYIKKGMCVNEK